MHSSETAPRPGPLAAPAALPATGPLSAAEDTGALAEVVLRLFELHQPTEGGHPRCRHDRQHWPCRTVRIVADGLTALAALNSAMNADPRHQHLRALARDINAAGSLTAEIIERPGEPLILRVVNPAHHDVAEDIGAEPLAGTWWYVWKWGNKSHPVLPVTDRPGTVATISHVLGLRTGS